VSVNLFFYGSWMVMMLASRTARSRMNWAIIISLDLLMLY
jgi:hypothetical protein